MSDSIEILPSAEQGDQPENRKTRLIAAGGGYLAPGLAP